MAVTFKKAELPSDGCETTWIEQGPLAQFMRITIHKVAKDVPARAKYRIPFQWQVQPDGGASSACGWAKTRKEAIKKATAAQYYILRYGAATFKAPDYLSDKWENMVAD